VTDKVGQERRNREEGPRHVRTSDPRVRDAASRAERAGLGPTVYREFPGGHEVGAAEIAGVVGWWLGKE
jgi:hypothetical protein